MKMTYRPLSEWPRKTTPPNQRRVNPFKAPWSATMLLLTSELEKLGAREVVVELDMDPSQIRNDGLPRSGARTNGFPGVAISFLSRHGHLSYASDSCSHWEQNVRAIALGLSALRAVDRYGITSSGEQYSGFAAITAGPSGSATPMGTSGTHPPRTAAPVDPREIVARLAGREQGDLTLRAWLRMATFAAHPDHGGSAQDMDALRLARMALDPDRG